MCVLRPGVWQHSAAVHLSGGTEVAEGTAAQHATTPSGAAVSGEDFIDSNSNCIMLSPERREQQGGFSLVMKHDHMPTGIRCVAERALASLQLCTLVTQQQSVHSVAERASASLQLCRHMAQRKSAHSIAESISASLQPLSEIAIF